LLRLWTATGSSLSAGAKLKAASRKVDNSAAAVEVALKQLIVSGRTMLCVLGALRTDLVDG
jgi:hypothetical protein